MPGPIMVQEPYPRGESKHWEDSGIRETFTQRRSACTEDQWRLPLPRNQVVRDIVYQCLTLRPERGIGVGQQDIADSCDF